MKCSLRTSSASPSLFSSTLEPPATPHGRFLWMPCQACGAGREVRRGADESCTPAPPGPPPQGRSRVCDRCPPCLHTCGSPAPPARPLQGTSDPEPLRDSASWPLALAVEGGGFSQISFMQVSPCLSLNAAHAYWVLPACRCVAVYLPVFSQV